MDDPDSFDPLKIGRYTVIRVYYEYAGQPPGEKLFVVLRHDNQAGQAFCWCIKATSQTQRFQADPELLAGCVAYKKNDLRFFPADNTIIDPANHITMTYDTLRREANRGRYKVEGRMPSDFHVLIVEAIKKHPVLEPKRKAVLLAKIGENL